MILSGSKYVVNVDESSFEADVIEKSKSVPVLVDFWAPWCGPCRTLGPILEKLAAEYRGAFLLAKVNSDECPSIAMQFGVQGIPNVILFRDGQAVDRFVGAYPESSVRKFLEPHCPSEADKLFSVAQEHTEAGRIEEAKNLFEEVLKLDPEHPASHLALAKILISSGHAMEALPHLEAIPGRADEYETAFRLREVLTMQAECQEAGGEPGWKQRLTADPHDLDARYGLGCCLAASGKFKEALEEFLEIVKLDKNYRDQAPRKAMLAIFSVIGERSEMADEFRARLARTLY